MILDFGDGFFLRQASADDHDAMLSISLKTGNAGEDATEREDDPDLIGLIYTVPYQLFEPDFAFVIVGRAGIAGYVLGTPDTPAFFARLAIDWYPEMQSKVADPGADRSAWAGSDWARHAIHHPDLDIAPALQAYRAHGHIDLLPGARGRGIGRRAMTFLEQRLADAGSDGLWLPVHPENRNALGFYRRLGFAPVDAADLPKDTIFMAKRL